MLIIHGEGRRESGEKKKKGKREREREAQLRLPAQWIFSHATVIAVYFL